VIDDVYDSHTADINGGQLSVAWEYGFDALNALLVPPFVPALTKDEQRKRKAAEMAAAEEEEKLLKVRDQSISLLTLHSSTDPPYRMGRGSYVEQPRKKAQGSHHASRDCFSSSFFLFSSPSGHQAEEKDGPVAER